MPSSTTVLISAITHSESMQEKYQDNVDADSRICVAEDDCKETNIIDLCSTSLLSNILTRDEIMTKNIIQPKSSQEEYQHNVDSHSDFEANTKDNYYSLSFKDSASSA